MTPGQQKCLAYLRVRLAEPGVRPTFNEIAAAIGLRSKGNVARLLDGLEARGHIRRIPGRWRALELVAPDGALSQDELAWCQANAGRVRELIRGSRPS